MEKLKKTIKWCFIIATICICLLTIIAGYIIISNQNSQNTANSLIHTAQLVCNTDSVSKSYTEPAIDNNNKVFKNADSTDTSLNNVNKHTVSNNESQKQETSGILDSVVYNLTLAVNSVNNVLTSGSIFIAILTLFIGLVGLFGYHSLKTDVKEELDKTISTVDEKNKDLNDDIDKKVNNVLNEIVDINHTIDDCCKESKQNIQCLSKRLDTIRQQINEDIQNRILELNEQISNFDLRVNQVTEALTQQSRYFEHTIDYLYQATYTNISQMEDQTQAERLLDDLFHELQIATLHRTYLNTNETQDNDINKNAALEYLEENGRMEDISHLEYVALHDPNEHVRRRAIEVRAIIRSRFNNQSDTIPPVVS